MTTLDGAKAVLDRDYLVLRGKLLELAAGLDRIDRAPGSVKDDARYRQMSEAVALLLHDGPDRTERIQLALSLPYDANWRAQYGV
jgi:hypothetical protein